MVAVHEQQEVQGLKVRQEREVVVRIKNNIGVLFEISNLISEKGINILAVCGNVYGEDCVVRLVTDDNRKARETLSEHRFSPREENVVVVELPHRPGMLKTVTRTLADDDIDIHHVYGTIAQGQDKCLLAFHSANDEAAMRKLQQFAAK
jgi:hypothetical protein